VGIEVVVAERAPDSLQDAVLELISGYVRSVVGEADACGEAPAIIGRADGSMYEAPNAPAADDPSGGNQGPNRSETRVSVVR